MWIRTMNGELLNLANAESVGTNEFVIPQPSQTRLIARYPSGNNCVIAKFNTFEEARTALADLYDWIADAEKQSVGSDFYDGPSVRKETR